MPKGKLNAPGQPRRRSGKVAGGGPRDRPADTTTGPGAVHLVDRKQDIALLRIKLEAANDVVKRFEDHLSRLQRTVEVLQVDANDQGLAQAVKTVVDALAKLYTDLPSFSLVADDVRRACGELKPDVSSALGRLNELLQEQMGSLRSATSHGQASSDQLVSLVKSIADRAIKMIQTELLPIVWYRSELIAAIAERHAGLVIPETRRRGRPEDPIVTTRDKRLRELRKKHRHESYAEFAKLANQDPYIQAMGAAITPDIARDALNPGRKKPGKK